MDTQQLFNVLSGVGDLGLGVMIVGLLLYVRRLHRLNDEMRADLREKDKAIERLVPEATKTLLTAVKILRPDGGAK